VIRRKKLAWVAGVLLVLAAGGAWLGVEATSTDRRVKLLLDEVRGRRPDAVSRWLIGLGLLRQESGRHREDVAGDLLAVGPPAVPQLIEALEGDDEPAAVFAADVLGRLGNPRALEPLVAAMDDPRMLVRIEATEALGDLGDVRAAAPLAAAIESQFDFQPEAAADALVKLGPPAFEPVLAKLKHEDTAVRALAARILGELGDRRAVEPLIRALGDGEWHVRSQAAWALGELGDGRATGPLTGLLYDDNGVVRAAVATALGKLGVME